MIFLPMQKKRLETTRMGRKSTRAQLELGFRSLFF
jgi:hypothetical protein